VKLTGKIVLVMLLGVSATVIAQIVRRLMMCSVRWGSSVLTCDRYFLPVSVLKEHDPFKGQSWRLGSVPRRSSSLTNFHGHLGAWC